MSGTTLATTNGFNEMGIEAPRGQGVCYETGAGSEWKNKGNAKR